MAFSNLMLTTEGRILFAKAQQGKVLKLTRVGIGDGLLGSGSMVNRTALISEKMSLLIDAVQLTNNATEAAVITTLSNKQLLTGFYFRELGIFAEDPDTKQEKLYLYDNAGSDGEFIPDKTSSVVVYERIKMLITVSDAPNITFVDSGNPVNLTVDDIADDTVGTYSLWSSSKINAKFESQNESMKTHIDDDTKHVSTTTKSAPVDADSIALVDSADGGKIKRVLWSKVKSLFAAATHRHSAAEVTSGIFPLSRGGLDANTAAGGRDTLNVYSKNEINAEFNTIKQLLSSIGDIKTTTRTDLGDDWLLCNGENFEPSIYPALAMALPTFLGERITVSSASASIDAVYGYNGTWVAYSSDGYANVTTDFIAWTRVNVGLLSNARAFCYNGTWVLAGNRSSGGYNYPFVCVSTNPLVTWNSYQITTSYPCPVSGLYCYNGQWAVVVEDQARIFYTTNPSTTNWSDTRIASSSNQMKGLTCYNGIWATIMQHSSTSYLYITSTISSWNSKEIYSAGGCRGILCTGKEWVTCNDLNIYTFPCNSGGSLQTPIRTWAIQANDFTPTELTYDDTTGTVLLYGYRTTKDWTVKQIPSICYTKDFVNFTQRDLDINPQSQYIIKTVAVSNGKWFAGGSINSYAFKSDNVLPMISADNAYVYIKAKEST